MFHFWSGKLTHADIDVINVRVMQNDDDLPNDICHATHTNKDCAVITTALFQKHCGGKCDGHNEVDEAMIVFALDLQVRAGRRTHEWKDRTHGHLSIAERAIVMLQLGMADLILH